MTANNNQQDTNIFQCITRHQLAKHNYVNTKPIWFA